MSAKYELDGYRPLRPWVRGVSYFGFIITAIMAYVRVSPGLPTKTTLVFVVALIITFVCALRAYWDARVTAQLRRKGARKVRVGRRFAQPQFTFFERGVEWDYYNDPEPTTLQVNR